MSSRTEQYNEAKTNWETARQAMTTGETARIRRDAAEDVEFWGNKMAMLRLTTGWAA